MHSKWGRVRKRTTQEVMMKHRFDNVESNALWLICMYTYLRKYRSPFLHGVFLFSKVGVLVVNFDGFFAFAYSSHLLWFWPLGKTWYHHTSLSSASLSQRLPILLDIFLEWESWSQPYHMFLYCLLAWSCPQVFNSGLGWGYVKEDLTRSCFHAEFLEFQSYSKHRNYFDIDSNQTHSEKIQVIPMERLSKVMKTFCFAFRWKIWSDI